MALQLHRTLCLLQLPSNNADRIITFVHIGEALPTCWALCTCVTLVNFYNYLGGRF